ncbi:TonB-dependent receptor [Dasania sp. GY-MA-18]|uniref:TonB-dependent receptor plug domain-containing protein n=1 Tax=Dasania sp. GY-MA-18 TaxID=2966584 RepID=UPI0021AC607D|nr:TonB-dependent receptor [Dasania sp. GY-MA-18]MCR8924364.1 TonB-dependent receptor [Dasania sp. GY-MA-18]
MAEDFDLFTLSLQDLLNMEVSVASKSEHFTLDAPSSVTVFLRKEIQSMGINSLEELMNFVPGFQSSRDIVLGSGHMIAGRGSSTPPTSYNLLIMIDGQRLSDDLSGGAGDLNHNIPLFNAQKVEVIRGPGSALYGTGAFSGVVNIITIKETSNGYLGLGNLGGFESYFNTTYKDENRSLSLSARRYTDDGEHYGAEVVQAVNPNVSSTHDPRDETDFYLAYSHGDNLQINARHMRRQLDDFFIRFAVHDGLNRRATQQDSIRTTYQVVNNDSWGLSFHGAYTESSIDVQFEATAGTPSPLAGTTQLESEWEIGLDSAFNFSPNSKWFAGANLRKPDIEKARILSDASGEMRATSSFVKEGSRDVLGIYLQNEYRFSDQLQLTLGLRRDDYSDFGVTTNPRAALIYSSNFGSTFKVLYGEAFRAPSIRQSSSTIVGNPDLDPETIKTQELIWFHKFDWGQFGATYFNSTHENKITTVPRVSLGLPTFDTPNIFTNLPTEVNTEGWELELLTMLGSEGTLRATYTLLNEVEPSPNRVPKNTFSLISSTQFKRWGFNLNAYYHDEMEMSTGVSTVVTLDDYWVVNSALRYSFSKKAAIIGRIKNLLDKDYFSSSAVGTSYPLGIPNRGRTYTLGVELNF